jgi:thiaminase/transcriptional activator TenA
MFVRAICFLVLSFSLAIAQSPFSRQLWDGNVEIYQAILKHPFLIELQEGTLDKKAFIFYMIQDAHYLREFARALNITAAKAPRDEWATLLSTHAAETLVYERSLHDSVFKEYGISKSDFASFEPSPEAFGYTSHLVATAHSRPFHESLAALLPCYWIYWEVGKHLQKEGSKNPTYQKWIEAYSSEAYADSVRAILEIVDHIGKEATPKQRQQMNKLFERSARYEWMFWDSSYHRNHWSP